MTKPLIIMALAQEAQSQFDDLDVVFSGVGKFNAAHSLMKAMTTHNPSHIINLGTAGSSVFKAGEVIHCTQFIQRDMDVSPLGFERFQTPFEDTPTTFTCGTQINEMPHGVCGTGDSFDVSGSKQIYDVVDMEAYALARICADTPIPFTCIKYISDGADGQAANDWNECLKQAAKALRAAYDALDLKA